MVDDDPDRQIDLLEDMEEDRNLISSEENIKTPDTRAIEKNLRKKMELKQPRKLANSKRDASPQAQASTKSFIE